MTIHALAIMTMSLMMFGYYSYSMNRNHVMLKRTVSYYEDNQTSLQMTSLIINEVTLNGGVGYMLAKIKDEKPTISTLPDYKTEMMKQLQLVLKKYKMKVTEVEFWKFERPVSKSPSIAARIDQINFISVSVSHDDGGASNFKFKIFLTK